MKTDVIRFHRLVPIKPLWLFYVLLYLGEVGITMLLIWLITVVWLQWSISCSNIVWLLIGWLVYVALLSVAYVDVDLQNERIVSANIFKHIGVKIEIPVQDIQEIRLHTEKRYGSNVSILTREKTYDFSIDDYDGFITAIRRLREDIRITGA